MKIEPTQFADSHNLPKNPLLRDGILYGGLLLIAIYAFIEISIFVVDRALPHISTEREMRWFGWVPEGFLAQQKTTIPQHPSQHLLEEKLKMLPERFCGIPCEQIKIRIVDEKIPNAYAVPGGLIIFTTGLLQSLESQNGLVFVLGHELGHFVHRDHLRGIGRNIIKAALSLFFASSDAAGFLNFTTEVIDNTHAQEYEIAADLKGLEVLNLVYGHVGGSTEFFEKMKKKESNNLQIMQYLSTHPASEERIKILQANIAKYNYSTLQTMPLY